MKALISVLFAVLILTTSFAGRSEATIIEYTGEITNTSGKAHPNPDDPSFAILGYGEIGDCINILINFDPITSMVNEILVNLEQYINTLRPHFLSWGYFNAPDDWSFQGTTTQICLTGNTFQLNSDSPLGQYVGEVNPVPEPSSLLLLGCGLAFFGARKYRISLRR